MKEKLKQFSEYLNNNRFYIGLLIIVTGFVVVRLPYFVYLNEPDYGGDVYEYYTIASLLFKKNVVSVGYPAWGYPLFLRICQYIYDSTWVVALGQSIISLISLIVFYIGYNRCFGKYLIYVSIIILGFSASNATLYFETSYCPDSLLSSCYVCFLGIAMLFFKTNKNSMFILMNLIAFLALAIRPSAIILLPSLVLLLLFVFYNKVVDFKAIRLYVMITCLFSLLLCTINYLSPLYRQFNIITYPSVAPHKIYAEKETEKLLNDFMFKNSELKVNPFKDHRIINDKNTPIDTLFACYRNSVMYGYLFYYAPAENCLYASTLIGNKPINIDSVFAKLGGDRQIVYTNFKKKFVELNDTGKVLMAPHTLLKNKLKIANFYAFFKLFSTRGISFNGMASDVQNHDFYNDVIYERLFSRYVANYLGNSMLDDKFKNNTSDELYQTVIKEKKYKRISNQHEKEKMGDWVDDKFWAFKSAKIYRWIIGPYYQVQETLFRNSYIPVLFLLIAISSLAGIAMSRFRSFLFLVVFISAALLLMTNYIHSVHQVFLYLRYTHQVSFMYYAALIFLPLVLESFLQYKKTGTFKY